MKPDPTPPSRRHALQRLAVFGGLAASPFALNLATMGAAAAQSAADYKALVCVFLLGGNDAFNTMMPAAGAERARWQAARPELILPGAPLPLSALGYNGVPQAFASQLAEVKAVFDAGRCAVLANVGPLVQPMSLAQWNDGAPTVPVPPQIASHSDQQNVWQTGVPDKPVNTGWLGRITDLMAASSSGLPLCMSVGGDNILQVGEASTPYQLTLQGPVKVQGVQDLFGAPNVAAVALEQLLTQQRQHLMENYYSTTAKRAIEAERLVSAALLGSSMGTSFPETQVGRQLRMVARMVAARRALGQSRQVYYVGVGGWDFHGRQVPDQTRLLTELSQGLAAFYQATVALGVANQVTTFTASDFGRALQTNGDGCDHGWGGHHLVLGGAVKGQRIYGAVPDAALRTNTDIGQGRLLPTTSVDAYAATLARWFGVSDSNLNLVLPNVGRFLAPGTDLGMLA